jgi:hypothetical protein
MPRDAVELPPTLAHGRHVDDDRLPVVEPVQLGGGSVREEGPITAGEYRREHLSASSDGRMADCIDPAVDRMQPPRPQAYVDRPSRHADGKQLSSCDHPVLSCCQAGNGSLAAVGVRFPPYRGKRNTASDLTPVTGP